MENDPGEVLPNQTKTSQNDPSKELALRDEVVHETTQVTQEQWDEAVFWVLGDPVTGRGGLPHVAPFRLEKKFGLDTRTATAMFEEMQAQGWITKVSIPTPATTGKAVREGGYDQTRFGGYMVLVNPDQTFKPHDTSVPYSEDHQAPEYKPAPQLKTETGFGRFLGRSGIGKAIVGTAQYGADYGYLKAHHAKDSADFLTKKRGTREHDAKEHKFDRLYAEIFNPELGLPDERGNTIVTSWMKSRATKSWERTVPRLGILPDTRGTMEREVEDEIRSLRAQGRSDDEIKREFLKSYHPDREDGGDEEITRYINTRFMKEREHEGDTSVNPEQSGSQKPGSREKSPVGPADTLSAAGIGVDEITELYKAADEKIRAEVRKRVGGLGKRLTDDEFGKLVDEMRDEVIREAFVDDADEVVIEATKSALAHFHNRGTPRRRTR